MEELANKGNGNYFYLDSFDEARRVFSEKLAGTVEVVAKDLKLQVEFNPAHVSDYRLIGYENRALAREDFANDAVDSGDVGRGHTVTALYEVTLKGASGSAPDELRYEANRRTQNHQQVQSPTGDVTELAFLKLRYKEPQGAVSQLRSHPIVLAGGSAATKEPSADFRFAAAVSAFGHALAHSEHRNANVTYNQIADLAAGSLGADPGGYRAEFVRLVKTAAKLAEGGGFPH